MNDRTLPADTFLMMIIITGFLAFFTACAALYVYRQGFLDGKNGVEDDPQPLEEDEE